MAITDEQQAEILYKKIVQGKASTGSNRSAAEEPISSAMILTPQNFWFDAAAIPQTAPTLDDLGVYSTTQSGVTQHILQYYAHDVLSPVAGSVNAFYSANLRDSIPYNYDPLGSYLYTLKDATGKTLAFGLNNWVVDNQAGVLTFYDGVPSGITLPLTISFYKYIGRKSFEGLVRSDGSVQMDAGYEPTKDQDVVTLKAMKNNVSVIDVILDKLKPTAPADLSSEYLTISGVYAAYEAGTGNLHADCINNTKPSITPNGPFADGDSGVLIAYLDGAAVGTKNLSVADDSGTFDSLVITSDVDPYAGIAGKQNFYKQLYASIMPVNALGVGRHAAKLSHSITGSTPVANFHVDDPQSPTITGVSIYPPATTTRYISGVPSVSVGDTVQVEFTVNGAVKSHYGALGAQLTSSHIQNATFPVVGTPANGATLAFIKDLPILSSVYTERLTMSIVGLNSMQHPGAAVAPTAGIRIDTVSNEVRVRSGSGLSPIAFGGAFDSTRDLTNISIDEELQLLNGVYQWPAGNYLSNKPIAGPDYRSVPVPTTTAEGYRWVTFQPVSLVNANGFYLSVAGAQNWVADQGSGNVTSGIRIFARVMSSNGTPITAWIDCNKPYPGVGAPGSIVTKQLDPAMVAGDVSTSATVKRVTFGPTVRSGLLYIRIGITQTGGQKFASVSVQPN